jgi:hypothetical protein
MHDYWGKLPGRKLSAMKMPVTNFMRRDRQFSETLSLLFSQKARNYVVEGERFGFSLSGLSGF